MSYMSNLNARELDRHLSEPAWMDQVPNEPADEPTPIPAPGTLNPSLANAVARILQVASQAAMQARTDRDLLNALSAIQSAAMAGEMEFFGPEQECTDDIPF